MDGIYIPKLSKMFSVGTFIDQDKTEATHQKTVAANQSSCEKMATFSECTSTGSHQSRNVFITCDEDARVFLRGSGAAGFIAVPPAHLPGQTAKSVEIP